MEEYGWDYSGEIGEERRFKLGRGVVNSLQAIPREKEVIKENSEGDLRTMHNKFSQIKAEKEEKRGGEEIGGHATWEDLAEEEDGEVNEDQINRDPLLWIKVKIGGKCEADAVIDSGATHSCIDGDLYKNLKELKCV